MKHKTFGASFASIAEFATSQESKDAASPTKEPEKAEAAAAAPEDGEATRAE